MKKTISVLLLFGFLLSACSSAAPATSATATQFSTLPAEGSQQAVDISTSTPTLHIPTITPTLKTETPPPSPVFSQENYPQFTGTTSYFRALEKTLGVTADHFRFLRMDFSRNGQSIALVGCLDSCLDFHQGEFFLAILDSNNLVPPQFVKVDPQARILDVAFSPGADALYYSVKDEVVRYDLASQTSQVIWTPKTDQGYAFLGISPDGTMLAISNMNSLNILSLPGFTVVKVISGNFFGNLQSPLFSSDSQHLVIPTRDLRAEMTMYDTATWTPFRVFLTEGMSDFTLSPDGNLMAQGYSDTGEIRFLDVNSGELKMVTKLPISHVNGLSFDPSGNLLVVAVTTADGTNMDENLRVINVSTGTELAPMVSTFEPRAIWFSADGTSMLVTDYSNYLTEKWSLPTPDLLKADTFVKKYFDAIATGDYATAAQMTSLDEYDHDVIVKSGLDPNNLIDAFKSLCLVDEVPCLPLGRIVRVGTENVWGWDYIAYVTLKQPDGTEVMFDGLSPYQLMGVKFNAQGEMKIITLHPGMTYPFDP